MTGFVKFKVDPTIEAIGLYRDPNDNDEALADPLNHLDKVIFHPALRYCGIVQTITGTLSLPAAQTSPPNTMQVATRTIAAHGQSGRPMILGVIKNHPIAGADVAWLGSVPVHQWGSVAKVRWLTLCADDTNIMAFDVVHRPQSGDLPHPAQSISYEIHIFDVDLESALPSSSELKISNASGAMEITTPKGVVSMHRRYVKAVNSGGLIIPGGRTINTRWVDGGTTHSTTFRFWHGSSGPLNVETAVARLVGSYPASAPSTRTQRVTF